MTKTQLLQINQDDLTPDQLKDYLKRLEELINQEKIQSFQQACEEIHATA